MLDRLRAAIDAGRKAASDPVVSPDRQIDEPPRIAASWALIHFGDAEEIGPRLAEHQAFCLGKGVRCLFVSDDIPLSCVRSRDILFEFAPWPARTALTTSGGYAAAVDHCFRRLGLIMRFWRVAGCTWEGDRASDLRALAPAWAHPALVVGQSAKITASPIHEKVVN
jgi:hypothetical protein